MTTHNRRRAAFNLETELRKAVDYLLAEVDKGGFYGKPYFSATDLEQRVRSAVSEMADGVPYGSRGRDGGYWSGIKIQGLNGRSLLDHCRTFLFSEVRRGKLRGDQPSGKHTCTGLRFRRAGTPLTESETRTAAAKEKGPVVHYDAAYPQGSPDSWQHTKAPACQANRAEKPRRFSFRRSLRKMVRVTNDPATVTCAHCRRLLAKEVVHETPA